MNYKDMLNRCVKEFNADCEFAEHVHNVFNKYNPSKEDVIAYMTLLQEEMNRIIEAGASSIDNEYTLRLSLSLCIQNWAMVKGYFVTENKRYKQ